MKRNNPVRDCINLSYIEFLKLKNYIKVTMTNPLTAIKSAWAYIFPIIIFAMPLFTNKKSVKRKIIDISIKNNFTLNIILLIVTLILLIVLLYCIYSAANQYRPSQFSISDANYLFSSPIEPRTIYLWTMLRSIINSFGTILFFMLVYFLYGYRYFKLNLPNFGYVAFGLLFLVLFLKSLSFFIYSMCMKFKIGKLIKIFVYLCMAASGIYVIGSIIYKRDILKGLFFSINSNVINNVPILGWTKDALISPFFPQYNPLYKVIALFIVASVFFFLAVYFATDYYEEAVGTIEIMERNKKAIKSQNADDIQDMASKKEKNKEVKAVKDKFDYKGAWAFVWKARIVNHRTSSNVIMYIFWVLAFVVSMIVAYFERSLSSDKILSEYLIVAFSMVASGGMGISPLKYERTKQYLFIIPGKAWEKMIALHFFDFIRNFMLNLCIVLPIVIMNRKANLFGVLFLLLGLWGTYIVTVFNKLLINLIMPSFDDGKNGFLMIVFDVLVFAPAGGVAALAGYFLFHSIVWGLLVYCIGIIATGAVYCVFMQSLFGAIEMR